MWKIWEGDSMNGVAFELGTQFGMAGNQFTMADILWINGHAYQINMYPVEVE
jgi:hypothetical protein